MRPKTDEIDKLQERIIVRVTTLEKRILQQRYHEEGYRTMSDFCRAKLVKKREIKKIVVSDEFVSLTQKMDYELNKMGVNLNQLTKAINSNQVYQFNDMDQQILKDVLDALIRCFSVLEAYLNQIENH